MKNVLNDQSSEYDCGPTSLVNALRYLFERCEIHPELIKAISLYTLDTYNEQGESGRRGTSRTAMQFLASWFNRYGESRKFPISAAFHENERVVVSPNSSITGCLQQGGAAVVRCLLDGDPHYVLLTRALGDEIGLFDPYAVHPEDFPGEKLLAEGVRIVDDQPCVMNRIVKMDVLNSQGEGNYAMGRFCDREAMLLFNKRTRRTECNAVEYMI
ncbi:MAG: peptidase C39 [Eubacteriales bacterium]|nr:peptidase C39 [Eubacteriales bacterium]